MNVLFEAILVGLMLIPVHWISEKIVGSYGNWVIVFVSGALFHLIAEVTGINKAYVMTKK